MREFIFTVERRTFNSELPTLKADVREVNYSENEFCQILAGRSILRDTSGRERQLQPGDNFTIPAGFRGQWEVLETTRKMYIIYQP
jgi:uncharacterized cupin superfamily protein